jgi:membrane associated rhomboid family serine protease
MFFPLPVRIRHRGETKSPPIANSVLIAINTLVFVLGWSASLAVGPGTGIMSVLTYGFAHADLPHLLGNMWLLWVFGTAVNQRIGNRCYLGAYLGTVLVLGVLVLGVLVLGVLVRLFFSGYAMGSSGAIFGVIAMAVMLLSGALVDVAYVAIFPLTLLIGLIKKPKEMAFWFLRWGKMQIYTICFLLIVPLIELWGLWRWKAHTGDWNWTNLAHLLGFLLGIGFVLLLPSRISMDKERP